MRAQKTRTDIAREFGYPWPWKIEELLREEYQRRDGDIREIARVFGCTPRTIEKWLHRFGIQGEHDRSSRELA